jgi:hypothetical protein
MRQTKFILHCKNLESIGYCILVVCITVANTFGQSDTKADEKSIAHLKKFRSECVAGLIQKKPVLIFRKYPLDA